MSLTQWAMFVYTSLFFNLCMTFNLQVSSNGLITLGQPFYPWWPIPFPYGMSRTAVIAPYWTDFDFRNNLINSGVYYHFYDVRRVPYQRRTRKVMDEFVRQLNNYSRSINDFEPRWLLVVTWKYASPYPAIWHGREVSKD